MTTVAFLGLGSMGAPMAARLLEAGHDLRVWNRTPGRDEALVSSGAQRAATPADGVRDAQVAITMLADPAALEEVLFGPDGVASATSPTATLIDMSTVGPEPIRSVVARLAPTAVLDAPVLGSVPSAESGRLTILAGGDRAVFERHAELLAVLGSPVHVGPSGVGAALKLVANAATISTLVAVGELLALTDRTGLDQAVVLDGLHLGPLASFIERWRERLEDRYDRPDFRLELARKDLALVLAEAERAGVALTMVETAAARSDEALAAGLGPHDFGAVAGFLRR
ncbi:MAG: NAD(P)-dependent oxidoreductase [Actinobacteria bacterium]|nr:NAD(P)-dependent oxidoreductase [Actinomycetota bacterium]